MNKTDLIDAIAHEADVPKAVAGRVLDAALKTITTAMKDGDPVNLVGFGSFTVKRREARIGRNPQTGTAINIAASYLPVFKAGKALKDACN